MQLVWAENIVRKTNKPVLIITPLAVSMQTVDEGEKFGIECQRSKDGKHNAKIVVTNYERLHYFNSSEFAGCVCDESSILKNFDGAIKSAITQFMKKMKYRLLCTATAAPNDYIEFGTSSEALGGIGYMDMLGMFFKNDQNSLHPTSRGRHNNAWYGAKWRFKPHAERNFWRWLCSWARAVRKPSDLGFDDGKFILPDLITEQTIVKASRPMDGMLFMMPAKGLTEQRQERRHTIKERCEEVSARVENHNGCSLVWCHLNDEGNMLEKIIPNSRQIQGSTPEEEREEITRWFCGEICTCQLRNKSVKLAECGNQNTRKQGEKNITQTKKRGLKGGSKDALQSRTKNTCENTISPTNQNSSEQPNNNELLRQNAANGTEPILSTENAKNSPPSSEGCDTQTRDSRERLENTDCRSVITNRCLNDKMENARFVAEPNARTRETKDSISTIATKQESSEDCSVRTAILDSENSKTIHPCSSEPQCTCGYKSGKRVLISKPKVLGFGLNFQHCNHMTIFPSHSYEQYYQGVRRCWRFGQKNNVKVDIISTEGESDVMANMQRKSEAADKMFAMVVEEMGNELRLNRSVVYPKIEEVPSWLQA